MALHGGGKAEKGNPPASSALHQETTWNRLPQRDRSRRSVYQVLYHEEGGHDPMSAFDVAQTTPIDIEC